MHRALGSTGMRLFRLGEAYPALVRLANGNWIIVSGAGEGPDGEEMVSVIDPLAERQHEPLTVGKERFCANWQGEADPDQTKSRIRPNSQQTFGFRWFIPELLREWRLFADVAVAAILLYALGLALPIFFQLVIDKVLVHESFTTLYVLAAGAADRVGVRFASSLSCGAILLLYATNRIDIRVATKTFGHLLGLPDHLLRAHVGRRARQAHAAGGPHPRIPDRPPVPHAARCVVAVRLSSRAALYSVKLTLRRAGLHRA